jgi:hypothetical protein
MEAVTPSIFYNFPAKLRYTIQYITIHKNTTEEGRREIWTD